MLLIALDMFSYKKSVITHRSVYVDVQLTVNRWMWNFILWKSRSRKRYVRSDEINHILPASELMTELNRNGRRRKRRCLNFLSHTVKISATQWDSFSAFLSALVEETWSTQRKPTQTQGEQVNSSEKGARPKYHTQDHWKWKPKTKCTSCCMSFRERIGKEKVLYFLWSIRIMIFDQPKVGSFYLHRDLLDYCTMNWNDQIIVPSKKYTSQILMFSGHCRNCTNTKFLITLNKNTKN